MGIRPAQRPGGPDVPRQRPPPGPRCRCGGQDGGRAIHWVCVGRARCGGAGAEAPTALAHGPGGSGLRHGGALGHPGRVCSGSRRAYPAALGSRAFLVDTLVLGIVAPTGWKPGRVAKKGPRDTLSQKVLRMASQHGANARGGGFCWETPPPPSRLSLERFDRRATQQKEAVGSRGTARRSASG